MLAMGENPKVVAERLGHSGPGITLRIYSHVLPGIHRQAADRIGQLLASGADENRGLGDEGGVAPPESAQA
jgi:hypothetical protein